MQRNRRRVDNAHVALTRAAIQRCIAVEDLVPAAATRHADLIVVTRHRSEVQDDDDDIIRSRLRFPHDADDAVFRVAAIDPVEAFRRHVQLVQRWRVAIRAIQILDPALQRRMRGEVEQVPVQTGLVAPLTVLPELAAHEQQFLARLRVHVREQQPQVRELLPFVARHLADERALAVHDFIVRQRKHEVLGERVHHAERQIVVVILAMDGIVREVAQRVVHPPHVPLHAESQSAHIRRPRHHRPRRRLLGDRLRVGL